MARSGSSEGVYGLRYLTIVAAATIVVTSLALLVRSREAALGAAVLGIYALHLLSVRLVLRSQGRHEQSLRAQLERLQRFSTRAASPVDGAPDPPPGVVSVSADGAPGPPVDEPRPPATDGEAAERPVPCESGEIPIARHFALGTVALIRQLLTPAEVARVLMEQRQQPDRRFASLAVEMGLLSDSQREELLLAQQEGLFTELEMREARERLREFRESTAKAFSELG